MLKGPNPDIPGCDYIKLKDEDIIFIESDNELQDLINRNKLNIYDNEIWYFDDDPNIISILNKTFLLKRIF